MIGKNLLHVCNVYRYVRLTLIIVDLDQKQAEIRLIESEQEANILSCNAPKFSTNMVPKDVVDLSNGQSIAEFAEEFEKAMKKAEQGYDSSSDYDDE